ncbi:MAG: methyltransferase [Kiritimatiellia bacterium]
MNPTRIIQMASAFYESCVLFASTELGLFAKLAKLGEADASAVAKACNLNERGTRLLMDACVALGFLEKHGDSYRNSPEAAAFLVPGSPHDLTDALRYNRDVYPAWGKLTEMVKTGLPVERPQLHLGEDEERTRRFVLSMHGRALAIGQAVIPLLRLPRRCRVLDVGGGAGTYSMLIARRNPDAVATVIDLPSVIRFARELLESEGLADRVKTIAADYHQVAFPKDNDAVLFFGVLHQESPEAIRSLLARAFQALVSGGAVYIMDMMTDRTHTSPRFSALFAINMALTTEYGWVFSDEELAGWLADAGFIRFSCQPLPLPMPHWLATAYKP